jgi:hypothetical protein
VRTVTKPGEQPPACVVESCDKAPAAGDVHCPGHLEYMRTHNGSAVGPPITEPDDPALIERTARAASVQEEKEYAERRRVKTWKTLENGSRVPETYWSDEELEAIEAEVAQSVRVSQARVLEQRIADDPMMPVYRASAHPEDPINAGTRAFKRALKGKHGPAMQKMAEALVEQLYEQA